MSDETKESLTSLAVPFTFVLALLSRAFRTERTFGGPVKNGEVGGFAGGLVLGMILRQTAENKYKASDTILGSAGGWLYGFAVFFGLSWFVRGVRWAFKPA